MATCTVRVRLERTATNSDPVYWSWAFDQWTDTTVDNQALKQAVLDGIAAGVTVLGDNNLAAMSADLVEIFPGDGGPAVFVETVDPPQVVGTATASNHILQCAVNELVATARGTAVKGRIFIGPLANLTGSVISNIQKDGCVRICQEVAEATDAIGVGMVVLSRYDNKVERANAFPFPIVGFRADNRLDILKSRRIEDTTPAEDYPLIFTA